MKKTIKFLALTLALVITMISCGGHGACDAYGSKPVKKDIRK